METKIFTSYDGRKLSCSVWDEVSKPIGIVQIVHGMAEHSRRYDDFANYLNKNGLIVFADDHRAHGNTMEKQGYDDGDIFNETIRDEIEITKYLKNTYHLPVIIFGHSYGSFLVQGYIQRNALNIAGAVLCGSANMDNALTKFGAVIANMAYSTTKDKSKPAKKLNKLTFGSYNKNFKDEGLEYAWLTRDKSQVQKYIDDEQCGYVMSVAFFKYFINGLKNLYKPENLAKIPKSLPIRLMSGKNDPISGKDNKEVNKLYQTYVGLGIEYIDFKIYDNDRHEILNEMDNDKVYEDTLAFITHVLKEKTDPKEFKAPQNKSKKKIKKQEKLQSKK